MNGSTMQALLCESFGPPEDLVLREVPVPQPGQGEVLIRIHAAGLNFPDSLIIQDKYQIKAPLPFAPGGELSGTVAAVGTGVSRFAAGDRVAALTHWGGFAEYVVAKGETVTAVPTTMDLDTAAAFSLVYGTAHHALKQRGVLQPGETVLILGASGGVGLAAVEVAKAMGARVIAGASTAEKLAIAQAHGADVLVNYAEKDLKAEVKAITGGKGVDVVYDPVGDKLADPAFRTIGWNGRYLVIGFVAREPALHHANMAELYAMHASGQLKPLISARFPIARGGEAIRSIMDRKVTGKVIVTAE
jgi:NADPH:quinone reductase